MINIQQQFNFQGSIMVWKKEVNKSGVKLMLLRVLLLERIELQLPHLESGDINIDLLPLLRLQKENIYKIPKLVLESHGRRSLVGCSPGVTKSWNRTERLHFPLFTFMHWRRKWQPTPVFLPGESQGWGSLVGCRLWGCTELDTTEAVLVVHPSHSQFPY